MSDFFDLEVAKHQAVEVRSISGYIPKGKGRLPNPQDAPDKAIWFESKNFGYIYSAVRPEGGRKLLLKW